MSGIILPGKDKRPPENNPQSGPKIELPKGFTSKRERPKEETPAAPPPPATPAAPTAPAQAPAPSDGRRQQPEFLFPPTGAQIQCPSCRTPYVAPVFNIIDLGVNPELKGALLGGQINVASCPNCGVGGALGAPLLVHEPGHQFLGVFVPPARDNNASLQQQKAIGDLTQALMRKLPTEARKGYMLQPKQFMDWQRFVEQLWEFEGVTAEMLRRQRSQGELLQRLAGLANDPKALELALQRSVDLVDREFFALLDRFLMMTSSQGQQAGVNALMQLRNQLLDTTEVGKKIKQQQEKVRGILAGLNAQTTREQLLQTILTARQGEDGREIVGALIGAVAPLLDYQFLMLLTQRIETTEAGETHKQLEELRELVLAVQEQQAAAQQSAVQQLQQVLQDVLQAPDLAAKLREYADIIDENFLGLLAANIQAAQRNKATAAARRLQQVYDQAVAMIQENMPAEVRLLNELLSAPDKNALSQVLRENRNKLTQEFVNAMKEIEDQMREANRTEIADRIKSLRAQIALMV